jgi:hypothetical protein
MSYGGEEYIALLNTFSSHIAMDASKRAYLYREIRERIDRACRPANPASLARDRSHRTSFRRMMHGPLPILRP